MRFFHEWASFEEDVRQVMQRTELNGLVPCTDVTDDAYVVGSELGLTGRFSKYVCDAVSLACRSAGLPLQFGDRQAVLPVSNVIPDVVCLHYGEPEPLRRTILPIELKTFWTARLNAYPISAGFYNVPQLQRYLGQLVEQMRDNQTIYGVLSTYAHTVFVKRVQDCRFEMTNPIRHTATQPSVRQCFMAVVILASEAPVYQESPGFNPRSLRTDEGLQASIRESGLRDYLASNPSAADSSIPPRTFPVTTQTILFGGHESPVAIESVEVTKSIRVATCQR
ncbi:uncharacterized protein N7515_006574 [Penicillium bovifimosum]|uniref:Uncharacterized protein n=1 Tax=Penicillium bovifimosum TaxID=126998 RepID=A0A9W9L182_9EURO|nr:uncharacterized protein N7515_006574 [Penicillium bovifimosum]KAJ5130535.1 hypothetical protein N7515_006574 [Penicillium bovifimosum]